MRFDEGVHGHLSRKERVQKWFIPTLLFIGLLGYSGQVSPTFLGITLFGIMLYDFQNRIDEGFPLVQLVGLIATLQWVIGPILAYSSNYEFGKYFMRVGPKEYFSFALPGTSALVAGLHLAGRAVKQRKLLRTISNQECLLLGLALGAVSLVGEVASRFAPDSLQFVALLLSQFRYVGILYLLRWQNRWRWPLIVLYLLPLFSETAESAMFHSLLIWAGVVFCYWFALKRRTLKQKWTVFAIAAVLVFTIQAIKGAYREKVWEGEEASILTEAADFWTSGERLTSEASLSSTIVRMNQGWIVAAVMAYVPEGQPYAKGETVAVAVRSALIPRFLDPDKMGSGGQENFRRFTGLDLLDNTSMAISPIGEAYANFGVEGGILAMLAYGLFFGLAIRLCFRFAGKHPHFIFWIPLIFYQAIKAETELVTVLNQISKGGLLAFGCYWLIHTFVLPYISKSSQENSSRRGQARGKSGGAGCPN